MFHISLHGTWSAGHDINGWPQLVFSGYVMPPMELFRRRKKLVRVLSKIATRMANYVPLRADRWTNISLLCGRPLSPLTPLTCLGQRIEAQSNPRPD